MIVLSLASFMSKLVGVVFLFAAAVGLIRFSDPLQRMHAATKAGTLGAGFIVLGVVLQLQRLDVTLTGLAVVLFLLLTIPVAGHLLGRAAYVSGADIGGLRGGDALEGVLDRHPGALEARIGETAAQVEAQ
ncbi:monovalent cation/H(+) antiporter subunit G [Aureimonas phyllosphaerae]|uniref:Multicomponent Na+:H+ antiporter subunit G n=1 Tax=Aureimonas phyllosphaerae TaxID=1166078 RepID=A0A7W6FU07_9HYPH|nr:monovalent cation/H(+) antiporter subunit G [Aureimonas phyllosphaerae]MBB3935310.1 multicomponent Na+:H+ antiporter subunit G [Aureimonas phyllosphaerae]MBB3959318.1 multicomponent Na+:H+ antiporter subunit G [Aureimonas phyllosphaerae]SFF04783.1 multicomponent Na+:H+ antiporter subunit G [Aureimonas phyllosphaerae]